MKGKICGMNDDYDGKKKHVRVEVEHGRRKRSKPETGKGELMSHDMRRSTVTVPRKDASKFSHGQNVNVRLEADDTPAPLPPKAEKGQSRLRKVMRG